MPRGRKKGLENGYKEKDRKKDLEIRQDHHNNRFFNINEPDREWPDEGPSEII